MYFSVHRSRRKWPKFLHNQSQGHRLFEFRAESTGERVISCFSGSVQNNAEKVRWKIWFINCTGIIRQSDIVILSLIESSWHSINVNESTWLVVNILIIVHWTLIDIISIICQSIKSVLHSDSVWTVDWYKVTKHHLRSFYCFYFKLILTLEAGLRPCLLYTSDAADE